MKPISEKALLASINVGKFGDKKEDKKEEKTKSPNAIANEDPIEVVEEPSIKEEPLEVSEDDIKPKSNAEVSKFEQKIDDMFADFTIEDAIYP